MNRVFSAAESRGWGSETISGQLEGLKTVELVTPVELVVEEAVSEELMALPEGEVGILNVEGGGREMVVFAWDGRDLGTVLGGDLVEEDAEGPGIGGDVMNDDDENVLIVSESEKRGAEDGSIFEVEAGGGDEMSKTGHLGFRVFEVAEVEKGDGIG
jgi:hypothetical protein